MAEATSKDILASISRLGGASADEVAADLAVSKHDVMAVIADLAAQGYIRPLRRGLAITPVGSPRVATDELDDTPLVVTFRGFAELRS